MTIQGGQALLRHGHLLARRHAARLGVETARDLGAEAVLRAVRKPAPDGRVEPWLERIFRNLSVDLWRRRGPVVVAMDACPEPHAAARPRRTCCPVSVGVCFGARYPGCRAISGAPCSCATGPA